ncbi:Putative RNA recognition motif domain, eukaryote [[Torrubiella] hemipterigena]|uniref:Putative RNA recognition motif domain, eukaryote n=1 Tax=[Torrubiella] hemipterigena TaxID=1531966 RepID=A0A0A1TB33_9HYPO|nr:Putative RNA recognition motif domain, eukaryote [[Torrubiella] hemipterigena]
MAPQDSFIEEEEDVCPLCIEEFDLSDKNFRPCPCGYQVCQFCFNNIKNNMNGLCPACRRPYDEKTIQWKVVTTEEVAEFRANIQKNQKKRVQEQRQKEVQKREAEKENRKNLIGVRVVQKNLVYITGLAPNVREDELLKTLRKPEFFGQYGTIQKISISNRKSPDGQHHSLGIYVTFETPDEAMRCIQAVHGSHNGDRVLKAQHGTTKYCSAWLKNEKCNNPGCMFLHEQGDEEDSYTRQDLSSMNSIHTQRPLQGGGSTRTVSRQQPQQQTVATPPPPPPVQIMSQTHSMVRSSSKDGLDTAADGSALPSSANWARLPQRSRRGSHSTNGATPTLVNAAPATSTPELSPAKAKASDTPVVEPIDDTPEVEEPTPDPPAISSITALLNALYACALPTVNTTDLGPPMFDVQGGEKRRAIREDEEARLDGEQRDPSDAQSDAEGETGGMHHAGEIDERERLGEDQRFDQRQAALQRGINDEAFSPTPSNSGFSQNGGNPTGRALTPQQLMSMRSQGGFADQFPPGIGAPNNGFASQGHNRQSSRFNFANENGPGTNMKLAANSRAMGPGSFPSQAGSQFYATSLPGPPPGLKSTGTPPNLFGQGFGLPGFNNVPKDSSNELLQSLIGRNRTANGQSQDGKQDEIYYEQTVSSIEALVSDDTSPPPQFATGQTTSSLGLEATSAFDDQSFPNQAQYSQPRRPPPGFEAPTPAAGSLSNPITNQQDEVQNTKPLLMGEEEFPALGPPPTKIDKRAVSTAHKLATPKSLATKLTSMKTVDKSDESKKLVDGSPGSTGPEDLQTVQSPTPTPRMAPKALRVVSSNKSDVPQMPSPVTIIPARVITNGHRPETPGSEMISDSASVVSTSISISRPNSPIQSKLQASKTLTKSQQRKQRREALKQETKLIAETVKVEAEEHAPVIGRKKKQKKEKPTKGKPTPPASSVTEGNTAEGKSKVPDDNDGITRNDATSAAQDSPTTHSEAPETTVVEQPAAVANERYEVTDISAPIEEKEDTTDSFQSAIGPVEVFGDIRSSLWTSAMEKLNLFKPVSNNVPRGEILQNMSSKQQASQCKEASCNCGEIQPDDITDLRAGKAVRKQFHVDGSRMLITPNGDCIRSLSPEEEEDFLALQTSIGLGAENPGAFVAPRHQTGTGAFSLIKGRAVPNGRPNIFPTSSKIQSQDPIGKLQREDALSYINQYVLPRLNVGATGQAKNASSPRDTAAASLNSLAPYFYGPDAAAGVGIYSSADGGRPPHDFSAPGHHGDMIKGPFSGVGNMPLMAVDEAEAALVAAKKETEKLEKGLNAVIKRNRRLLLGGSN